MKSTTTRLAASVLAFTIPFVPSAYAETSKSHSLPVKTIESSASLANALLNSVTHATSSGVYIDAETKALIADAIESVASASGKSLEWHQARRSPQAVIPSIVDELHSDASTATDAAYAESAYVLSVIPEPAHQLKAVFKLILDGLGNLRNQLA